MDLRPVRNTELIEIRVYSDKPAEAALIANSIAEAYSAHRHKYRDEMSKRGIRALEDRWKDQEAAVSLSQSNVDYFRESLNISDPNASAEGPSPLITADTLRHLESLRIEGKANFEQQKTLLAHLQSLDKQKLQDVLPISVPDAHLSSLREQLTAAQQNLILRKKEYGPEHSEVKKLYDQVDDLQTKIDSAVAGIMEGLEAKVLSYSNYLYNIEDEVTNATKVDLEKARASRPYWDAKRKLDELVRFRNVLAVKIASEKIDVDLPKSAMVEIVERAVENTRAVRPNKPLNIALGIIIGLVVGVGLAFFIEYLDTSVKTIDDVERTLQAPVLGVIPQNVGLVFEEGAESPHAEAYRVLRTNLLFSRKDDKLNTVAVVSAGAGEGKTTTVFNLGCVFAQSGQRVLLVDSDLRRPTLHKLLQVTNNIGLTNYLLKQNSLEEVIQTTRVPRLDFLASGKLPSSSLGILSSAQMKNLIGDLKQRYDYVFLDSPPIMGVSDASILASEVDMTLQVIQYRRYPQPMNIRAKQLIEKVGGNLIGIVLNNINMSQDESYYYYSGYYHDYYSRNEDQEPTPRSDSPASGKDQMDIKQKY
jgi:capsular exopolysaccharide synthesis family protein